VKTRLILALVSLALMTGSAVELSGQKKKVKEKRFEPVVAQNLRDYEGTYTGIEHDYVIEIQATTDGKLKVNDIEDGQSLTLTNIKLTGARLTADKLCPDGSTAKFDATFGNRIINGKSAFGLHVDGLNVHFDGGFVLNTLFYPRSQRP
jgi:hypothetical protein